MHLRHAIPRPDLLPAGIPEGYAIYQLTREEIPSSHVYMEAQIFTPDSKRFILHRSAHPHGSDKDDPEHRYLLCDLEAGGELIPITDEVGANAPSVSPDGEYLYYFVNETELGGGRLTLKRVRMDGTERETLVVLDAPIPGTPYRPSRMYPLSTISSDGRRLATSCWLGDGQREEIVNGMIVFDLQSGEVWAPLVGPTWGNLHAQYCRSQDPAAVHDVLVQEDHDRIYAKDGQQIEQRQDLGIEIHVVRDDGTNLRNTPWGRDGREFCQGHQCWVGRSSERVITSTTLRPEGIHEIVEGNIVPHAGHIGIQSPGGRRNVLSREVPEPQFFHFATDIAGDRFIVDCSPAARDGEGIYVAHLPQDGSPLQDLTLVARPGATWQSITHIHPFLSPDGKTGFFNSDESGVLQAYMVCGW